MEAIFLFTIHSSTCTAVNTGFWFLDAAKFTKFCEMRFELCEMHEILLYKTKLITKFGSFWSEIRNEIWSISNEIQAKAK